MNLGKVRTYFLRALPPTQGLMLFMVWVGIPMRWWSVLMLLAVWVGFVYLDARWMLGQEQEVAWEKNPSYQRLMGAVLKNQNGISVSYSNPDWTKPQDEP